MNPIYVYIWFDIEDYVTRESDDLPLVAFRILEKYGATVTCKLVAEKVRRLEENGRSDVLGAIARRDVGFHLDTHSQHPTLYEYLSDMDVLAGSHEFLAREGAGLTKVRESLSKDPSCFGHGGPTWAPHPYPALREMNIPVYLDETAILNVNNQPYWYCGILNLNGANRNFLLFDYTFEKMDGVQRLKRRFKAVHDRLRKKGGGAVSLLFHLHTAINKKFWDEINFADGKNRRKEDYERPPAQPKATTERAWANFGELIRYISSFTDVKFITATDACSIYPRVDIRLNNAELREVANHFTRSSDYMQPKNGDYISPSEAFYAVVSALSDSDYRSAPEQTSVREPLGPIAPFQSVGRKRLVTQDFVAAAKWTRDHIDREKTIPSRIDVGGYAQLNPHDFLATACKLLLRMASGDQQPKTILRSRSRPPNLRYVNMAAFRKACKWKVLPHNFRAPKILEQARLQAWTLKPAIPRYG